ncbi:Aspartate transaminase [Elusimicrobium minutum Pei191]|uniref:Aminotransferase n=1 Tax=Elusimicrobium minutum (strain Pei191) TaxID=445932 RepID=B2KCQ8_ELUMP|nr:pyridoxal phosphate-dependent aminotransferase [Elusimicrobium minutum]ACC98304.1 Aspartate transaminase [Elusimicrobium minutum Pei191]
MNLSKLSSVVADSATLKINAKANALKKQGLPLIHLGGGEPEYPAPKAAVEAILAKAKTEKIKYSPTTGTVDLKEAVIKYTKDNYGKTVEAQNIIISSGAKQAIYNFLLAAVNPGDEVVFPVPYWVSYPEMVTMVSGVPVPVKPANGLKVTLDEVKAKITPKTKAVMVNSPSNPSGMIFDEAFIKGIVETCEEKGIFLLMDDIYNKLVFGGAECPVAFKYAKNADNLVVINGVSKLYGLTGLRIGWAVSENKDLIAAMGRMQAQTTSCNCDISEAAAAAVLNGDQSVVTDLKAQLEENRNALMQELKQIKDVGVTVPEGTFYTLVDFRAYGKNSMELAQFLLEKALVAVVPGDAFGLDGYARISYCASKNNVVEGARRIRWALDKTSPDEITIGGKIVKRTW